VRTRLVTLVTAAAALAALPVLGLAVSPASADNFGQVCTDLDSGKIDTHGDPQTVTVTAPAGKTIVSYCVKAGSINHGDGPVYVDLAEPVSTLVIRHPSGKAVSHYSLAYGDATSTEPGDDPSDEPTEPSDDPTEPSDDPTQPSDDPTEPTDPPTTPTGDFDWNWKYADPTCDALTVDYPADLPSGQANDVNIRLETDHGQVTLNYHNDKGTWAGTTGFTYSQHKNWPAGVASYAVTWVQVGGTNWHWQGDLKCRLGDADPSTFDVPQAVTEIDGWRTGSTTVSRGRAASADSIAVEQAGLAPVELQRLTNGSWVTVRTASISASGHARVTFPRETRRGTFSYRVQVSGAEAVTGDASATFTVRVR
jgi:hypothetical protein